MAFVPGYKHDVFVSYARVNDEPPEGIERGWVTTFVHGLRWELAQRLGRPDAYSLWMDHELAGNIPITSEIMDNLHHSATLVVVFSQGYLASPWCQRETSGFLDAIQEQCSRTDSRVFIIELDKSERPPEFGDLRGYRFFEEDSVTGYPRVLGLPQPQPNDREYYKMITTLSYDLVNELQRLKVGPDSKDVPAAVEARQIVFLADVTDDLHFLREDVKRYLTQANLQVLPETYSLEPRAFQNTVREDLSKSSLFVQLLSAYSGKKPPDLPQGYVYCQYELAQEMGIPILQWRSPELDINTVEDLDHRDFLQGESIIVVGIEEFKAEIMRIMFPQKIPTIPPKKSVPLVFVNKHSIDLELADDICQVLRDKFHVSYNSPLPSASSRAIERCILKCDGLMIVYGNADIEWVEDQFWDVREINPRRQQPLAAFAIYDGPPQNKPDVTFGSPEMHILRCRECLKEEEIRGFIQSLE